MLRIEITAELEEESISYRATGHGQTAFGNTAGTALDAVIALINEEFEAIAVTVFAPDALFTADQQRRMQELLDRQKTAVRLGFALAADEQRELESLINAELYAASHRTPVLMAGS